MVEIGKLMRVKGRPELGTGEVLRLSGADGNEHADVAFDNPDGRRLETLPLNWLEPVPSI